MHKKLLEHAEENHVLVYPSCLNEVFFFKLSPENIGNSAEFWAMEFGAPSGTFNSWSKGSCAKISLSWSDPSAIVPAEVRMFWVFPRGVCTEVVFETLIFGTNTVDDEKSCTTCVVYPTICDWFLYQQYKVLKSMVLEDLHLYNHIQDSITCFVMIWYCSFKKSRPKNHIDTSSGTATRKGKRRQVRRLSPNFGTARYRHRKTKSTNKNKTKQNKTRQDKTSQDKTRQNKTTQDKTKQNKQNNAKYKTQVGCGLGNGSS